MIAILLALAPVPDVMVIGVGTSSCATASLPQYRSASNEWIGGFWSGLNYGKLRTVGRTSDLEGLTKEVWHLCESEPSLMLLDATYRVYVKLEKEGR